MVPPRLLTRIIGLYASGKAILADFSSFFFIFFVRLRVVVYTNLGLTIRQFLNRRKIYCVVPYRIVFVWFLVVYVQRRRKSDPYMGGIVDVAA